MKLATGLCQDFAPILNSIELLNIYNEEYPKIEMKKSLFVAYYAIEFECTVKVTPTWNSTGLVERPPRDVTGAVNEFV